MSDAAPDKTIFRRRRSRYTSISNTPLRDKALTLEAVGFLACIMSLPEDWQFNRAWARKRFGVGREKLDRVIKELTAAGYVRRDQERYDDGKMGASIYTFTDEPNDFDDADDTSNGPVGNEAPPLPEKPLPGNPAAGQPAPTKYLEPTKIESVLGSDAGTLSPDEQLPEKPLLAERMRRCWQQPSEHSSSVPEAPSVEAARRRERARQMKVEAERLRRVPEPPPLPTRYAGRERG